MSNEPVFLYVEDDETSRNILKVMITRIMGYEQLIIFEDSTDFAQKIEDLSPRPTIIFLDIHMRPYDGFEMLEMLRESEIYRHARIIALTASVMNEEVIQLRKAGFDGGIAKPLRQSVFPELLNRILDGEEVWYIR